MRCVFQIVEKVQLDDGHDLFFTFKERKKGLAQFHDLLKACLGLKAGQTQAILANVRERFRHRVLGKGIDGNEVGRQVVQSDVALVLVAKAGPEGFDHFGLALELEHLCDGLQLRERHFVDAALDDGALVGLQVAHLLDLWVRKFVLGDVGHGGVSFVFFCWRKKKKLRNQ